MLKKRPLPHRHLKDLLPSFLENVESRFKERPDLVLQGWNEVIDAKWQSMTEACAFEKGVIVVKVKNAALYSLLVQQEARGLLKKMQDKFPQHCIKNIKFRIG